jgi:hypothetical protein
MINITYRLTRGDLVEAARLWDRHRANVANLVFGLLMCLVGTANLIRGYYVLGVLFPLLGLAVATNFLSSSVLGAYSQWRANPQLHEEFQLTLAPEQLHFKAVTSDSTLQWECYSKYYESDSVFLLVQGKRMYNIVPKRAFTSPEQMGEMRSLLASAIRSK